jgi:hypothetical protein
MAFFKKRISRKDKRVLGSLIFMFLAILVPMGGYFVSSDRSFDERAGAWGSDALKDAQKAGATAWSKGTTYGGSFSSKSAVSSSSSSSRSGGSSIFGGSGFSFGGSSGWSPSFKPDVISSPYDHPKDIGGNPTERPLSALWDSPNVAKDSKGNPMMTTSAQIYSEGGDTALAKAFGMSETDVKKLPGYSSLQKNIPSSVSTSSSDSSSSSDQPRSHSAQYGSTDEAMQHELSESDFLQAVGAEWSNYLNYLKSEGIELSEQDLIKAQQVLIAFMRGSLNQAKGYGAAGKGWEFRNNTLPSERGPNPYPSVEGVSVVDGGVESDSDSDSKDSFSPMCGVYDDSIFPYTIKSWPNAGDFCFYGTSEPANPLFPGEGSVSIWECVEGGESVVCGVGRGFSRLCETTVNCDTDNSQLCFKEAQACLRGDILGTEAINVKDFVEFKKDFFEFKKSGWSESLRRSDFNGDKAISMADYSIFTHSYRLFNRLD